MACVIVGVSFDGLDEFGWVGGLDRWEIEGDVCVVGVRHMWVVLVLGCVGGKRSLCLCAFV